MEGERVKKIIVILALSLCAAFLSSCENTSESALKPLLGLDWFISWDDAKDSMSSYTLLSEREISAAQHMQDYEDVDLFDYSCDLTLCFTGSGLIGFNYHDIDRNQNYKEWYHTLEATYGLPTEESSGMASWYDNPAGKDTAIYLFNLEEGVQVSIYVTADSPDKSYDRKGDVFVPAPEIRTPIVPVDTLTNTNQAAGNDKSVSTDEKGEPIVTAALVFREGNAGVIVTDPAGRAVTDKAGAAVTEVKPAETSLVTDKDGKPVTLTASAAKSTDKNGTGSTTTAAAAENKISTTEKKAEPPADHTKSFLLNGLSFYSSPDSERRKMSSYTQLYEYRTEEPGQPWELIMEYENVPYEGKTCDSILCFTSLGLVGVNYFDSNAGNYNHWVQKLTEIYGNPNETQYDYTAWSSSPVGNGTMIYVFALKDGVQISFFADDTGSELA